MSSKIIFLMPHPPAYELFPDSDPPFHYINEQGEKVGFWDDEWGDIFFNNFIKYDGSTFVYEVWQPDYYTDRIFSHTFQNGLKHILFPTKEIKTLRSSLVSKSEFFCPLMAVELRKLLDGGSKILVHLPLNARFNTRKLVKLFWKRIPFVFQISSNHEKHPIFGIYNKKSMKNLLVKFYYSNYFKKVKYIIPGTQRDINARLKNVKYLMRNGIANVGIDYDGDLNISNNKNEIRLKLHIPQNKKVFFASQRIVPEKQLDRLISAFANIDKGKFVLYISGGGAKEEIEKLNSLIDELGMTVNVKLLGYLSEKDLINYYKAADAFISSSASEVGPASTYKALLLQVPVITTNTGIAYEYLYEKKCGLIIDKDDYFGWTAVLREVIDGRPISKPDMEETRGFFDWENISKYYLDNYKYIFNEFYSVRT